MKNRFARTLWICTALSAIPQAHGDRTFTSSDGRTMEAEIVAATNTHVTLKKTNDGEDYAIPLERLSTADREFIAAWRTLAEANIRSAQEIKLTLEGGETKTISIPKGEYLDKDGTLTLHPGDEIHVEFREIDGSLGRPVVVQAVTHPERSITFSMTQKEGMTMLFRKTAMRQTVAMDCQHKGLGSDRFFRTNLFPTEKGLAAGDSWPETVWTLRLNNFEVTTKPASEVYEKRVAE